jgi:hypothetical protein
MPTRTTPRLSRLSAFAIVCGCTLFVSACDSDMVLQKSVPSPDGTVVVDHYDLSGGGGAGWAIDRVRLRPSTEPFQADCGYSFSAISAYPVDVRWISKNELEVSYGERGTVKTSQPRWKNVAIRYRAIQINTR